MSADIPPQTRCSPGFAAPPMDSCLRKLASLRQAAAAVAMLANLASNCLSFAGGIPTAHRTLFISQFTMFDV